MLLTAQRGAAAKRGNPVFDRACLREHRLEYGRIDQRRRASYREGPTSSPDQRMPRSERACRVRRR